MPNDTEDDSYTVYYKRKPALRLNARLIIQKNLSKDTIENIKALHVERLQIEETMSNPQITKDQLQTQFKLWTANQYLLQAAWNFPEDSNFHPSHRLPGCLCAKLDNDERLGTEFKVITQGCPIHDVGGNFK